MTRPARTRSGAGPESMAGSDEKSLSDLEEKFRALVQAWRKETSRLSSAARMAKHTAYVSIIGMGIAVVPLLLEELRRKPDHWFIALHAITGASPIPTASEGKVAEMAQAWIDWGQKEGYIE